MAPVFSHTFFLALLTTTAPLAALFYITPANLFTLLYIKKNLPTFFPLLTLLHTFHFFFFFLFSIFSLFYLFSLFLFSLFFSFLFSIFFLFFYFLSFYFLFSIFFLFFYFLSYSPTSHLYTRLLFVPSSQLLVR
jgi:hypothetical protein